MEQLNDDEINEFLRNFESQIGEGKLYINEVKNYMKLVDLPFEAQINPDNADETFSNLYCWYKCRDDNDIIKRMPDPYYSMYIQGIVDEVCN
jgi:hypothetical protein